LTEAPLFDPVLFFMTVSHLAGSRSASKHSMPMFSTNTVLFCATRSHAMASFQLCFMLSCFLPHLTIVFFYM